jgi:hypothetical protein
VASYLVYGLKLSTNLPVSGFRRKSSKAPADLHIRLQIGPRWLKAALAASPRLIHRSSSRDHRGRPSLRVWELNGGKHLRLLYADGVQFIVDRLGTRAWGTWPEESTLEDAAAYLRGPVLGIILRLRGVTCLHASAICVDGQGIALVGSQGSGKSTTAAALSKLGYRCVADDIVAVRDCESSFSIEPGYPRLCLWPGSIKALFGSETALPCIAPPWEKRYLDLAGNGGFITKPLKLAAIYLLGERGAQPDAPLVTALQPSRGFVGVMENLFGGYLFGGAKSAPDFQRVARMIRCVPVRRVTPTADLKGLSALCDLILDDFRTIRLTSAGRGTSA